MTRGLIFALLSMCMLTSRAFAETGCVPEAGYFELQATAEVHGYTEIAEEVFTGRVVSERQDGTPILCGILGVGCRNTYQFEVEVTEYIRGEGSQRRSIQGVQSYQSREEYDLALELYFTDIDELRSTGTDSETLVSIVSSGWGPTRFVGTDEGGLSICRFFPELYLGHDYVFMVTNPNTPRFAVPLNDGHNEWLEYFR